MARRVRAIDRVITCVWGNKQGSVRDAAPPAAGHTPIGVLSSGRRIPFGERAVTPTLLWERREGRWDRSTIRMRRPSVPGQARSVCDRPARFRPPENSERKRREARLNV